jgi:hypothetical protein
MNVPGLLTAYVESNDFGVLVVFLVDVTYHGDMYLELNVCQFSRSSWISSCAAE